MIKVKFKKTLLCLDSTKKEKRHSTSDVGGSVTANDTSRVDAGSLTDTG